MNDFAHKLEVFFKYFIDYENYKIVLTGLRNTLVIAICGYHSVLKMEMQVKAAACYHLVTL